MLGRGSRVGCLRTRLGFASFAALAAAFGVAGCGPAPEHEHSGLAGDSEPTASQSEPVMGGQIYESCTPARANFLRSVAIIGRTLASSEGFAQCVRHVFNNRDDVFGPYVRFPGDPPGGVEDVIRRARTVNPMRMTCADGLGTALAVALPGRPDHPGPDEFRVNNAFIDLHISINSPAPFAETLWHEAMHTHGYLHIQLPGPFTNEVTPGYTDTIALIVGHCMQSVLEDSGDVCSQRGDIRESTGFPPMQGPTCDAGSHPVVDDYPNGTSCDCVRDPVIAPAAGVQDRTTPILGTNGLGERYGAAVASGDFDGDGMFEVAVGAPGETFNFFPLLSVPGAGAVYLYRHAGNNFGLYPNRILSPTLLFAANNGRYGAALVAADFDEDGFDDLAVGVPGLGSGRVLIYRGSPSGLIFHTLLGRGSVGDDNAGSGFGEALAVRFAQAPTNIGLVVGAPGDVINGQASGAAYVFEADLLGAFLKPIARLTQTGVDADEASDRFGAAVATGRIDNDLVDDVVVGAPGEDAARGKAYVFSSQSGFRHTFPDRIPLAPPPQELFEFPNGEFGAAVAVGRFHNRNFRGVAVGAPFGGVLASGIVHFYDGHRIIPEPGPVGRRRQFVLGPAVFAFSGSALLTIDGAGISFPVEPFDRLAVGAPSTAGGSPGSVLMYRGGEEGPPTLFETLTQNGMGIDEPEDEFGRSLARLSASSFGGELTDEALIVGAPGEAPALDPPSGAAFLYDETFNCSPSPCRDVHIGWQSLNQED